MSKTTWKDATRYSRDDIERKPRTWEIEAPGVTIIVTRHIYHEPDVWLLTCREVNIDLKPLKAKEIEAAKAEAIDAVTARLQVLTKSVARLRGV